MNADQLFHQMGIIEKNDPARKGQLASRRKAFFGDNFRFALYPVHTRFGAVEWFVTDCDVDDNGRPGIIRQSERWQDALYGLIDLPTSLVGRGVRCVGANGY